MPTPAAPLPEAKVQVLYAQLLNSWNAGDAMAVAALFCEDGELIGADGSQVAGREEIAASLRHLFITQAPARHFALVRAVRLPLPECAVLRAEVGMLPAGADGIDPALNTVQVMVAAAGGSGWHIVSLQHTPARFDAHPERAEALDAELRQALRQRPPTR